MRLFDWLRKGKSSKGNRPSLKEIRQSYQKDYQFYYDNGIALYELGRHEEAIQSFKKSTELNPNFAWAFNNMSTVLHEMSRYEDALQAIEQAIRIDPNDEDFLENRKYILADMNRTATASTSDRNSKDLQRRATTYFKSGKYEEAISCIDEALEIDEEKFGADSRECGYHHKNRGMALISFGRYSEAIGGYERALAIFKRVDGDTSAQVAICLNDIGCAHLVGEAYDKALSCLEEAVSIDRLIHGEPHPDIGRHLTNLAKAQYNIRQPGAEQKARKSVEEAYQILRRTLGENHPDTFVVKQFKNSMK